MSYIIIMVIILLPMLFFISWFVKDALKFIEEEDVTIKEK